MHPFKLSRRTGILAALVCVAAVTPSFAQMEEPPPTDPPPPPVTPGGGSDTSYQSSTGGQAAEALFGGGQYTGLNPFGRYRWQPVANAQSAMQRESRALQLANRYDAGAKLFYRNLDFLAAQYHREPNIQGRLASYQHADVDDGVDLGFEYSHFRHDLAGRVDGYGVVAGAEFSLGGGASREQLRRFFESNKGNARRARKFEAMAHTESFMKSPEGEAFAAAVSKLEADLDRLKQGIPKEFRGKKGKEDGAVIGLHFAKSIEKQPRLYVSGSHRVFRTLGTGSSLGIATSYFLGKSHFQMAQSVERAWLNLDGFDGPPRTSPSHRTSWRYGTRITWRDRMINDLKDVPEGPLGDYLKKGKWRWMLGVDYTFDNPVDRNSAWTFATRHRFPGSGYHLELSGFVGESQRNSTIYGIRLQHIFG